MVMSYCVHKTETSVTITGEDEALHCLEGVKL